MWSAFSLRSLLAAFLCFWISAIILHVHVSQNRYFCYQAARALVVRGSVVCSPAADPIDGGTLNLIGIACSTLVHYCIFLGVSSSSVIYLVARLGRSLSTFARILLGCVDSFPCAVAWRSPVNAEKAVRTFYWTMQTNLFCDHKSSTCWFRCIRKKCSCIVTGCKARKRKILPLCTHRLNFGKRSYLVLEVAKLFHTGGKPLANGSDCHPLTGKWCS